MATTKRRKSTSVSEKLFSEAQKFTFFQATRLLQGVVRQWQPMGEAGAVGHDVIPQKESVRFAVPPTLSFQAGEVLDVEMHSQLIKTETQSIAEMQVGFMGLSGPSGVLPVFFTETELYRQREKDTALRDFLDLFNHRLISLFYRAWEKYRLPYAYERHALLNQGDDPVTQALHAMLGIAGSRQKKALNMHPEELVFYAGMLASPKRSASALETGLSEFLDVPVKVRQFKGEWLSLLEDDRTRLPVFPCKGKNNCLGVDMVIGEKFFTVEGKFELEVGPLNHDQFQQFLPGTKNHQALLRFTKLFVGASYDFDLQYKIKSEAIDRWILDETKAPLFHLGWNTWLSGSEKRTGVEKVTVHS